MPNDSAPAPTGTSPVDTSQVLVTLCTFNERENIEVLIPAIFEQVPGVTVLVIDDSSPDGTGEYVGQLAEQNPQVKVIHRSGKLGLGTATVAGFQFAIERGFQFLLNMDADFSHPPRFLPALIDAAQSVDCAIGSRYVPGGAVEGWGLKRHFMSRSINAYARLTLGLSTKDNSGSFRCYRVSKLAEFDWTKAIAKGYAFQEEILYRLKVLGARFVEVPFTFEERRFGTTKINLKEATNALRDLLRLRLGH